MGGVATIEEIDISLPEGGKPFVQLLLLEVGNTWLDLDRMDCMLKKFSDYKSGEKKRKRKSQIFCIYNSFFFCLYVLYVCINLNIYIYNIVKKKNK